MLVDLPKIIENFDVPVKGVFHVGAHYGQEIQVYSQLNIKNVVMFEPSFKNFEVLKRKLSETSALLVNLGLSSSECSAKLYVETANEGMSNSLHVPHVHTSQYPHIKFEDVETVNLTTLDTWLQSNPNDANIMTIDVQGHELEVLLGSQNSLKNIDLIICEVNRDELYKDCAYVTEIDILLRYHGFRRVATNWIGKTWGDAAYLKEEHILKNSRIPTIDIVDTSFAHAKEVLGFDSACLLPTSKFDWNRTGTGDFDVVITTDESVSTKTSKKKIAWLLEPRDISSRGYEYVEQNSDEFAAVVSHDVNFVSKFKNGIYSPFGGTWISPADWIVNTNKKYDVSIIASEKNFTKGHELRHESAKLLEQQHRFGKGYKKIENKIEGLKDYRFSIVIENSLSEGYFSEKLIDSLITCTIPIYWGSKSPLKIFDKKGIITFETVEELEQILHSIKFKEHYENVKDAVISNSRKARRFASVDELFVSSVWGLS